MKHGPLPHSGISAKSGELRSRPIVRSFGECGLKAGWIDSVSKTEDRDLRSVELESMAAVFSTSTYRPDGLRENYESGDRSMHYNYIEADLRPKPG
jgi:hypothetical protein